MSDNANEILSRIAVASLQKCTEKLSRVSAGVWNIAGANVSMETLDTVMKRYSTADGESAAVYFDVKGELPFVAILLFDPRDMERISKCFLGYSFSPSPVMGQAGELLLSELGNIILNSFVSALSNALKTVFIPSVPRFVHGVPRDLLEAMGVSMDLKQSYRSICVKLNIHCDKTVTWSEVVGLIPEKLAQALIKAEKDKA
jgi:chemotaxis protein CheY-P-specific phosphatase CheC